MADYSLQRFGLVNPHEDVEKRAQKSSDTDKNNENESKKAKPQENSYQDSKDNVEAQMRLKCSELCNGTYIYNKGQCNCK